jgi:hypothetical protein
MSRSIQKLNPLYPPFKTLNRDIFTQISTFTNSKNLQLVSKDVYTDTKHLRKIILSCEDTVRYKQKPDFRDKIDKIADTPSNQIFLSMAVKNMTNTTNSFLIESINEHCENFGKKQLILELCEITSKQYLSDDSFRLFMNNLVHDSNRQIKLTFIQNPPISFIEQEFQENVFTNFGHMIDDIHVIGCDIDYSLFANARTVYIKNSNLSTPLSTLKKVKSLTLVNCNKFLLIPRLPNLESLALINCDGLRLIRMGNRLNSLDVENCRNVAFNKSIKNMKNVRINDCFIHYEPMSFENINTLTISNCRIHMFIHSIKNVTNVNLHNCCALGYHSDVENVTNMAITNCIKFEPEKLSGVENLTTTYNSIS